MLDKDEDVVFLQSAFPDGRRCSPGLLSEELHAVRGETRVRSLHGHQHHHVQRNVLHAGKSPKVFTHAHGCDVMRGRKPTNPNPNDVFCFIFCEAFLTTKSS